MSIIRVNKTKDYTVMSNYHFREKNLSLKAKGLLSEMLSLPENWDYSIAGLVKINKESEEAIKNALTELKNFGYVKVVKVMPNNSKSGRIEYEYNIYEKPVNSGKKEENDSEKQGGGFQGLDFQGVDFQGVEKPVQYNTNNKILNNKLLNNIKEGAKKFAKPTIEEIQEYCKERNNGINANVFYDFYESKDWHIGKSKMKDWKACVRTWERRTNNSNPTWFKKETKKETLNKDELNELEELMKDFK